MKIVAIIPARGGSKGIPRKNIKLLADKPLIAHSIEASLKSKLVTHTVLSTEDAEIKQVALNFGADVIDRPQELAQDETKTAPVLEQVVKSLDYKPDIVLLLQPTCPLRTHAQIDDALNMLINSDNDSIFEVFNHGLTTHAMWKVCPDTGVSSLYNYHERPRRQDADRHHNIFVETGSIYAIKYDAFIQHRDFIGSNPLIVETPIRCDIDTVEDFEYAEKLLSGGA